jgi:hypothetical protein
MHGAVAVAIRKEGAYGHSDEGGGTLCRGRLATCGYYYCDRGFASSGGKYITL